MRIAALILLLGLPLAAQMTVVGEGAGGGAPTDATYWLGSANGSLSAEIVVNDIASLEAAISAYDFNDAANLTTGDIAAARMQTNVRTAIGAGLTNDRVPSVSAGVLVDEHPTEMGFFVAGSKRVWINSSGLNILDGRRLTLRGGSTYPFIYSTAQELRIQGEAGLGTFIYSANTPIVSFDDGQTALFQDQTATTGITSVIVKAGDGQSTNSLFSLKTATAGANIFDIQNIGTDASPYAKISTATGRLDLSNLIGLGTGGSTLRLTANSNGICWNSLSSNLNSGFDDTCINRASAGLLNVGTTSSNASATVNASGYMLNSLATIYPPSAGEPVDCTTSNDGSMYFDTTDQKLCICANDGTDDEWLMSDDYSHLTGHCSI